MEKKFFTLEQANEWLPFLKIELAFLQTKQKEFFQTYRELQAIRQEKDKTSPLETVDEAIFKLECTLEFIELEAQMHLDSIHAKGIQVKDIDIGLVDFPAIMNGEEVLLCWKQDEESITHYHGENEGFTGRKKL